MANILVTGGTGNIGMYAVAEFCRRGHNVVVFDQAAASPVLQALAPSALLVQGDIVDAGQITEVVRAHDIDHMLHLAAFLGPESSTDPIRALEVNCYGTANIFEAALRHGVKRVCWSSSIAALGVMPDYDGRLVDENYRVAPTTPYGASKYYCELMSGIYLSRGLHIRCVRPVFAFGLGKLSGSWGANYNRIIYNAATGRSSIFPAWSKNGLQIIYNKDQAQFCVDATLAPNLSNWLFNTPTEKPFSEEEFIALIRAVVPDADISLSPEPPFGSAFPPNVDGSRAIDEIGFKAEYGVQAGIREMVDYYRAHPDQGL
ncbi:NAD-dependent epimerase/dehydratase family protein [Sphingobium tyrosinilyticum]|uniref:NAD-dependent epimerase/dehydratase family protein n=1 Tax=Sphingobium tyrosinilyticum TaxID=2715436 RepID=A0ABV9EYI1_9SPHN